jgi:lysophospholipid acyltransferase (LPLAT)-like uncharacterized protein
LKIESWRARLLIWFGYGVLRLWESTLRYELIDAAGIVGQPSKRMIGASWHNRLLMLPLALHRFIGDHPGSALVSASRDGAWIAELVKKAGFGVVRGSTSRQGVGAVLQMSEELASGRDVVISPDGPRGPVYQVSPGIIFLAQKTGIPVMPMHLEYSSYWRLKSWDRFFIPRPFSKTRMIFGKLHFVSPTSTDEAFEAERLNLEKVLMALVQAH